MTGFGRKGLDQQSNMAPGAAPNFAHGGLDGLRNGTRASLRTQPAANPTSSRVDAFLAAERARPAETARNDGGAGQAGISDVAANFRGTAAPQKPLWVAYLLWFFFGQFSAHRFYLGAYQSACAQVGLMVFFVALVLTTPKGGLSSMGPLVIGVLVVWCLWVFGDVFVIHRIHRRLCRRQGEFASAFA